MCWLCQTESKLLIEDIIPGFHIFQIEKKEYEDDDYNVGDYALVIRNDPEFIWSGKPIEDPFSNLDYKQISKIDKNDERWKQENEFNKSVQELDLTFSPLVGYKFIKACMEKGYDIEKHGNVKFWFFDRIARSLNGTL